jgi:hypothetical protein
MAGAGTLMGGYADDLFNLFYRMESGQMVAEASLPARLVDRYELKVDGPLYLDLVRALPDEMASGLQAALNATEPSNTGIKLRFSSGKMVEGVEVKRFYHLRMA